MTIFAQPHAAAIQPGLYQFDIQDHGGKSRVHLRVDEDGSGLLVVNASRVVQLNPTAMQMAYLHLNKVEEKTALKTLEAVFNVPRKRLVKDYRLLEQQVEAIIDEDSGLCPVCDMGLEKSMPFSAKLSAPYRMDFALTYRCNNACAHCYNARPRNYPELDTQTWKKSSIECGSYAFLMLSLRVENRL